MMEQPNVADATGLPAVDVERIRVALGGIDRVTYAPPHVYPMSAPAFAITPAAAREVPAGALGLYVHVPFCNYGCTFCFYAKRVGARDTQMERYTRALQRELEYVERGTPLVQLYVGGGTPTALPAELLDAVLAAVFERMADERRYVHTVEGSPESLTDAHVDVLRRRGIGRVSLGVQSFDDAVLDRVARRHSGAQARAACERLLASGFIVNVDLIYGLPGQTEASFRRDFETVAACGADAVTAYNLRINERTPVAGAIRDDERLDFPRLVHWRALVAQTAASLGYTQTRWHAFVRATPVAAKPRYEDVTSLGNQFGIGMSARSRLGHTVYRNHADLERYVERVEAGESPVEETCVFGADDRRARFIALSIGEGRPLERAAYRAEFGRDVDDDYGDSLARLCDAGLLHDDGVRITLTDVGKFAYDRVTLAFYPQRVRSWLADRQQPRERRHG